MWAEIVTKMSCRVLTTPPFGGSFFGASLQSGALNRNPFEEQTVKPTAGTRLGPYEISNMIGSGGMGEVYRARDTRLARNVALKILPPHLSTGPEARERFEREART